MSEVPLYTRPSLAAHESRKERERERRKREPHAQVMNIREGRARVDKTST